MKGFTMFLAVALAFSWPAAAAHENRRIVGTIVKVQATQVDVQLSRRAPY